MDDKRIQYLPFAAINAYMRPDYRLEVIRFVLARLGSAPGARQSGINRLVKKYVQVPGFRNSATAPAGLKLKPYAVAFEKQSDLAAETMQTWSELKPELREQTFALLASRGWEMLPADADRTVLPGFLTRWKSGEDFDVLTAAFHEQYPDVAASDDDISLMVVWMSGRLPYDTGEGSEAAE